MVQPQPRRPSPSWLLYTNFNSGFRPPTPVGQSIGISYVAAPAALTLNWPGIEPTALAPNTCIVWKKRIIPVKKGRKIFFILVREIT